MSNLSIQILSKKIVLAIKKADYTSSILINSYTHSKEIAEQVLERLTTKKINSNPDIFSISDNQTELNSIGIEQVLDFIKKAQFKPFCSNFKIGIIYNAEKMTEESQNSILKTLEEPPLKTTIILATKKKELLIKTILSRCQIFDFSLFEEQENFDDEILQFISAPVLEKLEFLDKFDAITQKKEQLEKFSNYLLCLYKFFQDELLKNPESESLIATLKQIDEAKDAVEKNVNPKIVLKSLLLNI